ncbi:MAG TPA: undecaprenyl/decaprenyl-phosphate alpha-N-acetylglucosaminyl 1-phosphate transferase [Firmicutes bacterium]|nr:undecaprenyl/decaprenyl-phosphate alpha-N-acetylglucosaminyl 1-phosphate transferase [Bacillota bacterium]
MLTNQLDLEEAVAIAVAAFGVAAVFVPAAKRLALRLRVLDTPNERKLHHIPKARLGGLGVVPGVVAGAILGLLFLSSETSRWLAKSLVVSGVIFTIGLSDDFRRQSASLKLAVELAAAFCLVLWVWSPPISIGSLLVVCLSALWLAGAANAMNLSDGMDGLASGIAVLASAALGTMSYSSGNAEGLILSLALGAAALAFMMYNAHPAAIFLGDSGSLTMGFLLGAGALFTTAGALSWHSLDVELLATVYFVSALTLGVPVMDTLWAIVRRLANHKKIFAPDNGHLHHRLLRSGIDYFSVVRTIYLLSCLSGAAAVVIYGAPILYYALSLVITVSLMGLITRFRLQWFLQKEKSIGHAEVAAAGTIQKYEENGKN